MISEEKVIMVQSLRNTVKCTGRRKLTLLLFVTYCMFLIMYISYGYLQLKFHQTKSVNKEIEKKSHRCFLLSWQTHTLIELANGIGGNFTKYAGNGEFSVARNLEIKRSRSCNRFIMVNDLRGRTGNQMFLVASLIGLAYKYDVIPVIQEKMSLPRIFKLPNRIKTESFGGIHDVITCDCKTAAVYYNCSKELNSGKNISLRGYLQSWKYFEQGKHIIRDIFRSETIHVVKARKFLQTIARPGYQRVSIHVRRGDITRSDARKRGYGTGNIAFIEKARRFYVKRYMNVQFIALSDDKAWCRKNLQNITLSPFNDVGDDMALMMLSDHVIVTSGTFGWWGAWLSGGTTVYFKGHPIPGTWLDSQTSRSDFYPSNWIGIS